MQDTAFRMPALTRQVELEVAVARLALVEMYTPLHQFLNPFRPFGDDGAHGVLFAQSTTRDEGVAHMLLDGVLLALHTGNATLRPGRV